MKKIIIIVISAIAVAGIAAGIYFGVIRKNGSSEGFGGTDSFLRDASADEYSEPIDALFFVNNKETLKTLAEKQKLTLRIDENIETDMLFIDEATINGIKKMTVYFTFDEDENVTCVQAIFPAFANDYKDTSSTMKQHSGEEMKKELDNMLSAFSEIFDCELNDSFKLIKDGYPLEHDDMNAYKGLVSGKEVTFDLTFKDKEQRFCELRSFNMENDLVFEFTCDYDTEAYAGYVVDYEAEPTTALTGKNVIIDVTEVSTAFTDAEEINETLFVSEETVPSVNEEETTD